jgi:hypothetical protein
MCSSKFIVAMDVFVGFLGLFYIREGVGESLAPEVMYLFFLCIYLICGS